MSDRPPSDDIADETPTSASARGFTRQDAWAVLGALGAIVTVVTAVMFYFGWRRSDVQAREMSIDESLFGFSSQDYVLRSISSLYVPMLVLLSTLLAGLWVHRHVVRLLRSETPAAGRLRQRAVVPTRWLWTGAAVLAASSVLFTVAVDTRSPPWPVVPVARALQDDQWLVPLVLVVATLIGAYAWWVHRELEPTGLDEAQSGRQGVMAALLLAAVVALGGFWVLEEYATAVGREYARDLAASVDRLPQATVVSPGPLGLQAPGVSEVRIESPDGGAGYRTTGLRLLARSGGKMMLLHDGWTAATGSVIVLDDRTDLAWQFSR